MILLCCIFAVCSANLSCLIYAQLTLQVTTQQVTIQQATTQQVIMYSLLFKRGFSLVALALMLLIGAAQAQQVNIGMDTIDDVFSPVIEALAENDHKAADRELKKLRRSMNDSGDYHFLAGMITVLSMNDASAIRLPFLARRMRNQWNEALEKDPNHQLAHLSLLQFHANAPGLVGGDSDKVGEHAARLHELNSPFRFQADITLATLANDKETEEAAWLALFAAQPNNLSVRFNYIAQRINNAEYAAALTQMHAVLAAIDSSDEEQQKLQAQVYYQWGKLAAESGTELESGAEYLQLLLAENRVPEGMQPGWAKYRLAQIFLHQSNHEGAAELLAAAQYDAENDANLKEVLANMGSWCANNGITATC